MKGRVRAARGRLGFSMIETLVSIALIVLLAGVVLPSVLGLMAEQPVERARQAFASAADAARAEAQRSGEMVVVSCRVGPEGALELVSMRGKRDERMEIRDAAESDMMSRAAPMAEGFAPVPLAVLPANCAVRAAAGGESVARDAGSDADAGSIQQGDAPKVSWAFLPDGRVVKMNHGTEWVVAFADGEASIGVDTLSGQITVGEKRQIASAKVNDGGAKPVDDGFVAPKVEDGKFERKPMMESRQTPRNGSDRSRE